MSIDFKSKEYQSNITNWDLVDNITSGENVGQYLVTLNPDDKSIDNTTRNSQYRDRAQFYEIAGFTLKGLNDLLFDKDPKIEVPTGLEYVKDNVDGAGVPIDQQSQITSKETIKKGLSGLFVNYPKTEGEVSKAEQEKQQLIATIHQIDSGQIINYRYEAFGAIVKLTLVVIMETVEEFEDYKTKEVKQIRELALRNGRFIVQLWRIDEKTEEWVKHGNELVPTDATGNTWDIIPFQFIGETANVAIGNQIPMLGLSRINIGHYRNSADYEDSVWFTGQAQPWMSGVTQTHVDLMKKNNMYFGSRNLLGVPSQESFGIEAAPPNIMVREAMKDKIDLAIGLGARFITPGGPAKTATQAESESRINNGQLSRIATNISTAYTQALKWCASYMGVEGDISYELNQDFIKPFATAQDIQAMVAGFIQGAIPASDYHTWLKKNDLSDPEKTLEEFIEELDTNLINDDGE